MSAGDGSHQSPSPQEWLAADPDPVTRAELQSLIDAGDHAGIDARFGDRLRFGTAGLRGQMGAGPNRMNRVVVRQAAAALATVVGRQKVVIGYDARHNADVFASDVADVLAEAGCEVMALPPRSPTPILAFAVRHLGAAAGVMVTASHNPPGDSGLKVYLEDGAQIIPPHDTAIEEAMASALLPPRDFPATSPIKVDVEEDYLAAILDNVTLRGPLHPVAYTPLQGVGLPCVRLALERIDNGQPFVVADEAEPDPMFCNVVSPNPEHPETLAKVIRRADEVGTPLALANDPDADRLAAAVRASGNEWRVLSGDEIGVLLCDWMLQTTPGGSERVVASSIVSGRLVGRIAAARGATPVETLTGFKWIARAADTLDPRADGEAWRLVFGYEEALGFACNDKVRDKDGISAALHFVALCRSLAAQGRTPIGRLKDLAEEFGFHRTDKVTVELDGRPGSAVMEDIRATRIHQLGGVEVSRVTDYRDGVDGLPPTDLLRIDLADGSRVLLRPSGTEPLIKGYVEVVGEPDPLAALMDAVRELIVGV